MASTMLSMPSGWGSNFGALSFYYDVIFKEHVPACPLALNYYWYQKGVVIVLLDIQD